MFEQFLCLYLKIFHGVTCTPDDVFEHVSVVNTTGLALIRLYALYVEAAKQSGSGLELEVISVPPAPVAPVVKFEEAPKPKASKPKKAEAPPPEPTPAPPVEPTPAKPTKAEAAAVIDETVSDDWGSDVDWSEDDFGPTKDNWDEDKTPVVGDDWDES